MIQDASAKLMLSFSIVLKDLLRGFVNEAWLEQVDLSSVEPLDTEYTNDRYVRRLNDMVWKLRKRDGSPLYVVVMMEFQSTVEHFMAARMNMYVGLLFDSLVRSGQIKGRNLPHVVPLVLYGGERVWNAPLELAELIDGRLPGMERYANRFSYRVVSIHHCRELDPGRRNVADAWFRAIRARDYGGAAAALQQLIVVLEGPEHDRLRATITKWLLEVVLVAYLPEEELSQLQGVRELAEVKENMVKWSDKAMAQGQRRILVQQARARFGADTAAELSDQLERVSSSERLGAIGEWLLTCASGEALLAKVRQA
ncbi:MAG: Rpn family recombination-promoting nuclease/putative transposase [Acidobacteriia bacterium]|nr:Rpn family recombination-promoting nuclease/putative transposase [Terriglobia bacterium]